MRLLIHNRDLHPVGHVPLPPDGQVGGKAGQGRGFHQLVKGGILLHQEAGVPHLLVGHPVPKAQAAAEQHHLAVQVPQMQAPASGEGVRRRQGEEQVLLPIFHTDEAVLLHRTGQDDQLIDPIPQPLEQDLVLPHFRGDGSVRVQVGQQRRDLPQRGRSAGTHQNGPPAAVKCLDAADHIPGAPDNLLCVLYGHPAVLVQLNFVLLAVKQLDLQFGLQPLHGAAEGGL